MSIRLWLASVLVWIMGGVLFATCASCGYSLNIEKDKPVPYRPATQQMGTTVRITTTCGEGGGYGSGVIVSPDRILTAQHVILCEDGSEPTSITVNPGDGTERDAYVEIKLPANDIARIRLKNADLKDYMSPVTIGPRPKLGDQLCIGAAVPRWGYHCGMTQPEDNGGDGYFQWDWLTEFGNSGSGVYHDGKLVGLLVALSWCQQKIPCVGHITPLQGFEWLVPSS